MNYTRETPIKDVVAEDFRAAAIFQKYGLDFCCGGAKPIGEAASAKGFDPADLLLQLNEIAATPGSGMPKFNRWDAALLCDYIVENHHLYVREVIPSIGMHAEKVARVHGAHRPELVEVAAIFARVSADLAAHMQKEENVLFPYIRSLALERSRGLVGGRSAFGSVHNPISMMEAEHAAAGDEMEEIRRLTNDYTAPMDACATYQVLFQELADFEKDLHVHVHLENNILFPKAIALEESLPRTEATASCALPIASV